MQVMILRRVTQEDRDRVESIVAKFNSTLQRSNVSQQSFVSLSFSELQHFRRRFGARRPYCFQLKYLLKRCASMHHLCNFFSCLQMQQSLAARSTPASQYRCTRSPKWLHCSIISNPCASSWQVTFVCLFASYNSAVEPVCWRPLLANRKQPKLHL